jgi:hypothetical protein
VGSRRTTSMLLPMNPWPTCPPRLNRQAAEMVAKAARPIWLRCSLFRDGEARQWNDEFRNALMWIPPQ